jgi:hypothetical protein
MKAIAVALSTVLVAMLTIGASPIAAVATAGTAEIAGVVTHADGTPAPSVWVRALVNPSDTTPVASATTLSDGSYVLTGLPAGNYVLAFDSYFWFDNVAAVVDPKLLTVAEGATVTGIDFVVPNTGTITVPWTCGGCADESPTAQPSKLLYGRDQATGKWEYLGVNGMGSPYRGHGGVYLVPGDYRVLLVVGNWAQVNLPAVTIANGEKYTYPQTTMQRAHFYVRSTSGAIYRYGISSTGKPAGKTRTSLTLLSYNSFVHGDFNYDGVDDIIARNTHGMVYLFPGVTATTFGKGIRLGVSGSTALLAGIVDFDQNGNLDLAIRTTSGSLFIYQGDGHGGVLPNPSRIGAAGAFKSYPRFVTGVRSDEIFAESTGGIIRGFYSIDGGAFLNVDVIATGMNSFGSVFAPENVIHNNHSVVFARGSNGTLWRFETGATISWTKNAVIATGWSSITTMF